VAYYYSIGILKQRWIEAEETIMRDPDVAWAYKKFIYR
jgi:hypothetical protein